MSMRILTLLLSLVIVLAAAYFLAYQQERSHEVDVRAGEITAPVDAPQAFAEIRWYANRLESMAIEEYALTGDMQGIRGVMHAALDDMAERAVAVSDTMRCDWIQCNPKLCAPWCPTIDTTAPVNGH